MSKRWLSGTRVRQSARVGRQAVLSRPSKAASALIKINAPCNSAKVCFRGKQTSHFRGVTTVSDPIETLGHAARAGDWSGRIFAAQGKACDAQLPVDGRERRSKRALRWHDRTRAGVSFVFCRSILSYD